MSNALTKTRNVSGFNDLDNLPAEDMVTPKTLLLQPGASFVQNEDKLSDGTAMKGGNILLKTKGEIINGRELIIINYKNVYMRFVKEDGKKIIEYVTNVIDKRFEDGAIYGGQNVNAIKSKQFLAVLDGDFESPIIVDFRKSSYKNGKFLISDAKNNGEKLLNSIFIVNTERHNKVVDDANVTWYEMVHKLVGKTSDEEVVLATQLKSAVEGFGIKEEVETEDPIV